MNEGLLDLRRAKAFAATLDVIWEGKSDDTFLRWVKLQWIDHPKLVHRLTPGKFAPMYVRKGLLRKILDGDDRTLDAHVENMEKRLQAVEADIQQLRRRAGLPSAP